MLDTSKPLWTLTVAEYIELHLELQKTTELANTPTEREEYFTVSETANYLGVSKPTLWRWSKIEYLVPIKVGGILRYKLNDLNNLISQKELSHD